MTQNTIEPLLTQWEGTYKKWLLSFWLLLLLSQRKAYPYEMKAAIEELSQKSISADENSIYRALRRLTDSGIVGSEVQPSDSGPDRRYFFLKPLGRQLLAEFTERNIRLFQHPDVMLLMEQASTPSDEDRKG